MERTSGKQLTRKVYESEGGRPYMWWLDGDKKACSARSTKLSDVKVKCMCRRIAEELFKLYKRQYKCIRYARENNLCATEIIVGVNRQRIVLNHNWLMMSSHTLLLQKLHDIREKCFKERPWVC